GGLGRVRGGGAAGWPRAGGAQQPARPVMGFLASQSRTFADFMLLGFRQGLKDNGYVEGENVAIEYRWAENQIDQLPPLAADLVRRRVALIVAVAPQRRLLPKRRPRRSPSSSASAMTPSQNWSGHQPRPAERQSDRDQLFSSELGAKRMELLREMVPAAARVAVLGDPSFPLTESLVRDVETAAHAMGLQVKVLSASTSREINAAFASFVRERPDVLYVGPSPFFISRRVQLTQLAARHAVPAIYSVRQYIEAGGLMSYGTSQTDAFRQMGVYTGRILKGVKRTCQLYSPRSSSWSSMPRPPGCSTSPCRRHYFLSPTR